MSDKKDSISVELNKAVQEAEKHNSWFSNSSILNALSYWENKLNKNVLDAWINQYNFVNQNSKVAIIMAGNFPMAGFHDLISVIISGNNAIVKPSSDDKILIEFFVSYLHKEFPETNKLVKIVYDKLTDFDKVIATGSNNTFKYFEYYFREKKSLLRKNRTSLAVLSGNESNDELRLLSDDVFMYFGLGCRNVSKIFIPKDYNLDRIFQASVEWKKILNNNSYNNNYTYNKSVFLLNNEKFYENGLIILKESKKLGSPISVLYYEKYDSLHKLKKYLDVNKDKLQCIVSNNLVKNSTKFGMTQSPSLLDFADDLNTVDFLLKVNE